MEHRKINTVKKNQKIRRIMKKVLFGILVLIFATTVFAQSSVKSFVNDYAGILSTDEKIQIESIAQSLYDAKAAQYAVLIINSTDGKDIETFSYEQANGILGDATKNNGLLLIVAIDDRAYRFEVGKGIEPILNDAKVGRIGRNYLVPSFREQKYGEGIIAASQSLYDILVKGVDVPDEEDTSELNLLVFMIIIIVIIYLIDRVNTQRRYFRAAKNSQKVFGGYWGSGRSGSSGSGGFGGGGFGGGGASGGW